MKPTIYNTYAGGLDTIKDGNRVVETAVRKIPQPRIIVTEHGVRDDRICDLKHHGGINRAVHSFSYEYRKLFISLAGDEAFDNRARSVPNDCSNQWDCMVSQ